jgi:hypothetical protein
MLRSFIEFAQFFLIFWRIISAPAFYSIAIMLYLSQLIHNKPCVAKAFVYDDLNFMLQPNGYVDQAHAGIDPEISVFEAVSGGTEFVRAGGRDVNSRAYLSRFNFSGADQEKNAVLS